MHSLDFAQMTFFGKLQNICSDLILCLKNTYNDTINVSKLIQMSLMQPQRLWTLNLKVSFTVMSGQMAQNA